MVCAAACSWSMNGVSANGASVPPGAPSLQSPTPESLSAELARVRKDAPPGFERGIQESRILYYSGQYAVGKEQKKKLFEEGLKLGEEARKHKPEDPASTLWWTANLGSLAEIEKGSFGLKAVSKIESGLLELKKTHPEYEHAAADRVLGRIYHRAPSFISIGSSRKAQQHLREALAKFPDFPGNQAFLAEFLAEEGGKDEASRLALALLKSPELKKYTWDAPLWKQTALKVLQETGTSVPKESTD